MGNAKGDVTVVAFLDYNCGYCRANIPAIAQLIRSDPEVRVIYREYPVLGDESVLAARWALRRGRAGQVQALPRDALCQRARDPGIDRRRGRQGRARQGARRPGESHRARWRARSAATTSSASRCASPARRAG
ncbi:MAG: thioredoxin domain-containing protein [Sphingomonas sp.]